MKQWLFGMGRAFGAVSAIVMAVLALTGGYLVATGVIDRTKAKNILRVLKGEPVGVPPTPPPPQEAIHRAVQEHERTLAEQRVQQDLELAQLGGRLALLREEHLRNRERLAAEEQALAVREAAHRRETETYRAQRESEDWKKLVKTFKETGAETAAEMLLDWKAPGDPDAVDVRRVTDVLRALPDDHRAAILTAMFEAERARLERKERGRPERVIEIQRALGGPAAGGPDPAAGAPKGPVAGEAKAAAAGPVDGGR